MRLFLIGIAMGIIDVIPGISGGTVAFLTGIHEDLLRSIQSLHLQKPKEIAWQFLIKLGCGIVLGFIACAYLLQPLLQDPSVRPYLYACFLGMIGVSTWQSAKKASIITLKRGVAFFVGMLIAFLCSGKSIFFLPFFLHPIGLILAGFLAAGAMLLPGISGSYLLWIIGVYPFILKALSRPLEEVGLLLPLGIGIALGLICFSRWITQILQKARFVTLSFLTGLMCGGFRSLWPFHEGRLPLTLLCCLAGAFSMLLVTFFLVRRKPLSTI